MKAPHAAALALVIWLLMAPSHLKRIGGDNYMMENFDETWDLVQRYKSAEECANGLNFLLLHKRGWQITLRRPNKTSTEQRQL